MAFIPTVVLGVVEGFLLVVLLVALASLRNLSKRLQYRSKEFDELKAQVLEWNRRLEAKITERTKALEATHTQLQEMYLETVTALVEAMAAKDTYLFGHSHNVSIYAQAIASEMDLSSDRIQRLIHGCELHDLGKIAIPDSILMKAGPLTPEEYAIIKQHPIWGARILQPLTSMKDITEMIHQEHERWDGAGYPQGLKRDQIRLEARIISVADALDAVTSHRTYRKRISLEEASQELQRCAGNQFDPKVVEACVQAIQGGKITIASNSYYKTSLKTAATH